MNRIVKYWNETEKIIVGTLALGAVISAFYGVILRYIFRAAPDWMEEIVTYMIIWAVFIVASTLAEGNGHVAATLLVEKFPLRVRRILALFNSILALGFCGIIAWYGLRIVYQTYALDERSLTGLRFPLWMAYLSVAAGCTLVGIRYGMRIYLLCFNFRVEEIMESHEMSREEMRS